MALLKWLATPATTYDYKAVRAHNIVVAGTRPLPLPLLLLLLPLRRCCRQNVSVATSLLITCGNRCHCYVCVCVCRPIKCYVIVHFYVTVYVNRLCMLFICRNVHQYLMLGCPKGCLFVCVCVHVYQHLFTPQFVLICKLSETIFKRLYAAHSNSRAMKQ